MIVAALSVVPFYLTDALWKAIQEGYKPRILGIEELFKAGVAETALEDGKVLQGFTAWENGFELTASGYRDAAINGSVMFPHVAILVLGVLLAIFRPPAPRKTSAPEDPQAYG